MPKRAVPWLMLRQNLLEHENEFNRDKIMNNLENLEKEAEATKAAFMAFFDGNGNFLPSTNRNSAEFMAAQCACNDADRAYRESRSQAEYQCSVSQRETREANERQLAASRRLLERDAKIPGIAKSQAQLDAEYDAELSRNQE